MKIIAIDPGTFKSSYVVMLLPSETIIDFGTITNDEMIVKLQTRYSNTLTHLVVEEIKSYGNVIGDSILTTVQWTGRFIQCWTGPFVLIPRKTICKYICRTVTASDKNIRQAMIDHYGSKEQAIGTKAAPGPLYNMRKDQWQALAVAVAFAQICYEEKKKLEAMLL